MNFIYRKKKKKKKNTRLTHSLKMFSFRAVKAVLAVCILALAVQAHVVNYDIDAQPTPDAPE